MEEGIGIDNIKKKEKQVEKDIKILDKDLKEKIKAEDKVLRKLEKNEKQKKKLEKERIKDMSFLKLVQGKHDFRTWIKWMWWFIWEDDSMWSWIVNIVLAFVLIKFIVYPGLGLALGTSHPIVAVVSGSMEHEGYVFDSWWDNNKEWYINHGIDKDLFYSFRFKNGFNKGDIMVLYGKEPSDIEIGDVIVFRAVRPEPIIHRVVKTWDEYDGYYFQTKGDNNPTSISTVMLDETHIEDKRVIGCAVFRLPWLGYVKIGFVELMKFLHIM